MKGPTSDLILVKGLLLDVPDYSALIERLAVVLRPGGMLVVVESEPNYVSLRCHQELVLTAGAGRRGSHQQRYEDVGCLCPGCVRGQRR